MEKSQSLPRQTLTVKEVAALLGFSTNSIYKFLKEGRIQTERLGRGRFRIPREEIERFLGHKEHPGHEEALAPALGAAQPEAPAFSVGGEQPAAAATAVLPRSTPLSRVLTPDIDVHTAGAPDVFDWFLGVTLMLLGLAFLFPNGSGSLFATTGVLQLLGGLLCILGLLFLWFDSTGAGNRTVSLILHVGVVGLGVAIMLPYYASLGDWLALARVGALLAVLLLHTIFPGLTSEQRFALLLVFLGALAGSFVFADPTRLGWDPLISFVQIARVPLALGWLLILCGFTLAEIRKPGIDLRIRLSLFTVASIATLVFAIGGFARGHWDQVAFTLTLGTFLLFAPLSTAFERVTVRRRPTVTLTFLWVGGLLVAAVLSMQFLHARLMRVALQATEHVADRAFEIVRDSQAAAENALEGLAVDPKLAALLGRKDSAELLPFARTAYAASGGILARVFIADAAGRIRASYPLGESSLPEASLARETTESVAREGKPVWSEVRYPVVSPLPVLAVALPVFSNGGEIAGAITASFDFRRLATELQSLRRDGASNIAITDASERYVSHTEEQRVGQVTVRPLLPPGGGAGSAGLVRSARGTVLTAERFLPGLGWRIVAEDSPAGVYETGSQVLALLLLILFTSVLGTIFVALRLFRFKLRVPVPAAEG